MVEQDANRCAYECYVKLAAAPYGEERSGSNEPGRDIGGDPLGRGTRGRVHARSWIRTPTVVLTVAKSAATVAVTGLVGLAVASMPLGAQATSAAARSVPGRPAPVAWSKDACGLEARQAGNDLRTRSPGARVECARLVVPIDWARPGAGAITLNVTRVPRRVVAGDTRSTRVLFVNPGGPGVSADWMAPGLAFAEPQLHQSSDIIAVDPRGSGGSTPLACLMLDDGVSDYRNPDARQIALEQATARREVETCARENGRYLRLISTAAMVRDLDHVRSRLGAATIDYYGVSAGTWLGAHYAQTYPSRVGRFVFDANTQFTADWRRSFAWQPMGFERRFRQQFLPWLGRHHRTYGLGGTARAAGASYERLRSKVAAGELYGVTPNDLDLMVVQGLYFDGQFPDLAQVLSAFLLSVEGEVKGKVEGKKTAARVTPPASVAALARFRRTVLGAGPVSERGSESRRSAEDTVFMAVQCNDDVWDRRPSSYLREGLDLGRRYPLLGYTWVTSPCAYWPQAGKPLPRPTGRGVPPILMVQGELDPATPWEGASLAHRAHRSTRLLAVDDSGNHGSFMVGNRCVETAVNDWLVRGSLPKAGATCRGLPLPGDGQVHPHRLRPQTSPPTTATPGKPPARPGAAAGGASSHPGSVIAKRPAASARRTGTVEAQAAERVQRRFQQRLLAALT